MAEITFPFVGSFTCSLDVKSRVAIPKTLRETLHKSFGEAGDSVIVTIAKDGKSVAVYPVPVFGEFLSGLRAKSREDGEAGQAAGRALRKMTYQADTCQLDAQGRIRLSKELLDKAKLDKTVVFCGEYDYMQILDSAELARRLSDDE